MLFCLCPDIFSTSTSSSPLGFAWQPESSSQPLYQPWSYMGKLHQGGGFFSLFFLLADDSQGLEGCLVCSQFPVNIC